MPNCFQLTKIGEQEPTVLQIVDDELWLEFTGKVPVPNVRWYRYWYDTIGLELAMGRSFKQILISLKAQSKLAPIIEYLEKHYIIRCWYEHK
jgi:uncharacterized protein YcfL